MERSSFVMNAEKKQDCTHVVSPLACHKREFLPRREPSVPPLVLSSRTGQRIVYFVPRNTFPPCPTPEFTWLGSDRLVPVLDGSSRDLLPGELSFVCFPDWVYLVPLIPSGKLPPELKFKGFICSEMPLAAFHLTHHYSFSRPRVCFKIFLPLPPNPGESSFVKSIARCQTIHPS